MREQTTHAVTRVATGVDWTTWRDLRLRSLQDSPSAYGSTYEREAASTEAHWRTRIEGADNVSVLAWIGDVAVGMGGGFVDLPGWLHVVAMWTDPAYRGRGVGAAALATLETWAGTRDLRLHLDVNTANPRARLLYERAGFVATGETGPLREGSSDIIERMVHGPR